MVINLVRHGETYANSHGIIQGWSDTKLNRAGRLQARLAAHSFERTVEAIYSSDLQRAVQTANFFRDRFKNAPYYVDSRLRERNYGTATGQSLEEVDLKHFWSVAPSIAPVAGSESFDQFNDRVKEFIDMLRGLDYDEVLVVTHSGTINRIRDIIAGREHTHLENASVTTLTI